MFKYLTFFTAVLFTNSLYADLTKLPNTPKAMVGIKKPISIPEVVTPGTIHPKTSNVLSQITISSYSKPLDVATIQQYTGLTPVIDNQTQSYKISAIRNDLKNIPGLRDIKLLSWAAFKKEGEVVQLEGSLVITRNQINPVIALLLKNNISVTGLHDHIGNEYPSILYLKFEGAGTEKVLSVALGQVFNLLNKGGKSEEFPLAIVDVDYDTLNTALIDHLMKSSGKMQESGVYSVGAKQSTHSVAQAKSDIDFSGTNDSAMVEGDLVLNQEHLKKILPILTQAGISIIGIKEELPTQKDKVVEVHYYGIGRVASLARGLQKALNVSEE